MVSRMLRRRAVAAGVLFGFVAAGISSAAAETPVSFRGKTITLLIGAEAGGGTDATGRTIAPYLHKYLPGEPNVVVQNLPSVSGIAAANFLVHRTQPDGLTVLMSSNSAIDPVVYRVASAQYDPKQFRVVGGVGRGGTVIFISSAAQPRLYDKSAAPVVIGTTAGIPRPAMQPAMWCIEYLGWNAKWVAGYHGTNEIMLAFDRGEVDMTSTGNIFQIEDRLKSGQLKIVIQSGTINNGKIVPRPEFGDAPLFPEEMKDRISDPLAQRAYQYWIAASNADKWLGLAPNTPDPIVATYRTAFVQISKDRDFLDRGEKISDGFVPLSASDTEALVRTLADTPPEAIDYTKELLRKQGLRVR
jgi:tripartite-type tricarboxylate transporter receptor subunit TctC